MKAFLKAIEYYLPERVVTNEQLVSEFPEWTVEKIASKVGVQSRHLASEDETATDMAIKAADKLFTLNSEINKDCIDFVLFCSQSPDYFLPSSACIIQHKLELPTVIGAFDFNLGCSGYIYGLAVAKGLIVSGIAKNILLLTAETYNKYIHPLDKGNRTIFGDGASATMISNEGFAEIGDFVLGTDGSGAENLIVKSGASKFPKKSNDLEFDENGKPHSSDYLYMNGTEIFNFTQKNVPISIFQALAKNNLKLEDINLTIFHQANKFMLEFLRKKLRISRERFFINMEKIGNTVSSSIPIALKDSYDKDLCHGYILLCGFGVGYSWGSCILKAK